MVDCDKWQARWLCSLGELRDPSFIEKWKSLAEQCAWTSIFQEPEMVLIWVETKGKALGVSPFFCVMELNGELQAVVPACRYPGTVKNMWRRRIVPVGEPHFDYLDPLVLDKGKDFVDWDLFWNKYHREVEQLKCCEFFAAYRVRSICAPSNAKPDPVVLSPQIDFSGCDSLDDFLTCNTKSNHRGDIRRQMRRLNLQGELKLHIFQPDDTTLALAVLNEMISAYEELYKGTPSAGLFRLPGTYDFYERLVSYFLPNGCLHFSQLSLNGVIISWHFGFMHRGIMHYYKPTYSKQFRNLSPGKVHLALLVELGIKEKWRLIDMGGGTEPYKLRWANSTTDLKQLEWVMPSVRACVSAAAISLVKRIA